MDIIENWNLLNARIKAENTELITSLFKIHMGAFDDLRKGGHLIKMGDKPASEVLPTIEPEQRLAFAGDIGRQLIDASGELLEKRFVIKGADIFPNCVFIALAAILENLDGSVNSMFPDKKVSVCCEYNTAGGEKDILGKCLPILEKCYSWIHLSLEAHKIEPPAAAPPRYVKPDDSSLIFVADRITKIDVMRTVFGGIVRRGSVRKGDVLNVIDSAGRVLCNEGIILALFSDKPGEIIETATEGQRVAELLLAVEIPAGNYNGIFLVDGDKALASPKSPAQAGNNDPASDYGKKPAETKEPKKKEGFWSKLRGNK